MATIATSRYRIGKKTRRNVVLSKKVDEHRVLKDTILHCILKKIMNRCVFDRFFFFVNVFLYTLYSKGGWGYAICSIVSLCVTWATNAMILVNSL